MASKNFGDTFRGTGTLTGTPTLAVGITGASWSTASSVGGWSGSTFQRSAAGAALIAPAESEDRVARLSFTAFALGTAGGVAVFEWRARADVYGAVSVSFGATRRAQLLLNVGSGTASVSNGSSSTVGVGGMPTSGYAVFRIELSTTNTKFFCDGTLLTTIAIGWSDTTTIDRAEYTTLSYAPMIEGESITVLDYFNAKTETTSGALGAPSGGVSGALSVAVSSNNDGLITVTMSGLDGASGYHVAITPAGSGTPSAWADVGSVSTYSAYASTVSFRVWVRGYTSGPLEWVAVDGSVPEEAVQDIRLLATPPASNYPTMLTTAGYGYVAVGDTFDVRVSHMAFRSSWPHHVVLVFHLPEVAPGAMAIAMLGTVATTSGEAYPPRGQLAYWGIKDGSGALLGGAGTSFPVPPTLEHPMFDWWFAHRPNWAVSIPRNSSTVGAYVGATVITESVADGISRAAYAGSGQYFNGEKVTFLIPSHEDSYRVFSTRPTAEQFADYVAEHNGDPVPSVADIPAFDTKTDAAKEAEKLALSNFWTQFNQTYEAP